MAVTQNVLPEGVFATGGILERIVEAKSLRVRQSKTQPESAGITGYQRPENERRSFREALCRGDRVNVISEIKHRSPSKGVIRPEFDPVAIANSYRRGGAAALSILTEEDFFGGSLDHLRAVRRSLGDLPVLRKDFLFDPYQLYESAAAGADAVLLITAILSDSLLARLVQLAAELGLDALVEVHTASEMERAVRAGAGIIGVNNRDLTTFNVDLETSVGLARLAPGDVVLVSESGINTREDIRKLAAVGYHAFLVGEHLMRAPDPGDALKRLLEN